jgi:hypothetical protein
MDGVFLLSFISSLGNLLEKLFFEFVELTGILEVAVFHEMTDFARFERIIFYVGFEVAETTLWLPKAYCN